MSSSNVISIKQMPEDPFADGRVDFEVVFRRREDYISAGRLEIMKVCAQVCSHYWTMSPAADPVWHVPLTSAIISFTDKSDAIQFKLAMVL